MRVKNVTIEGYRSIKNPLTLDCDSNVITLVGANDHGKTNLLNAILHLNPKHSFNADTDLNWDFNEEPSRYPHLRFELQLSESDQNELSSHLLTIAKQEIISKLLKEAKDTRSSAQSAHDKLSAELAAAKAKLEETKSHMAQIGHELESDPSNAEKQTAESNIKLQVAEEEQRVVLKETLLGTSERELDDAKITWSQIHLALLSMSANLPDEINEQQLTSVASDWEKESKENVQLLDELNATISDLDEQLKQQKNAGNTDSVRALTQTLRGKKVSLKRLSRRTRTHAKNIDILGSVLEAGEDIEDYSLYVPTNIEAPAIKLPHYITMERKGLEGELQVLPINDLPLKQVINLIFKRLPRVEIIPALEKISDDVTLGSLNKNDFMKGIFYYSGLEREEWQNIFHLNEETKFKLEKASLQLDQTLTQNWKQGKNLRFKLAVDSEKKEIQLSLSDPSVTTQFVRPSKRSSGFTNFFALKTVLYAREREASASSYLWLFDEPGLYLHPDGQHDLIQVLETLSRKNQIIYTTHSLFMINKNYPARHRLVEKDQKGTKIGRKPFHNRWKSAIDALGFSLPGTILFAGNVLLVEGDSDPVYVYAIFQKLLEARKLNVDINAFSVLSTGESKHTDALIRILKGSYIQPKIFIVFDGDQGGKNRLKNLKELLKRENIKYHLLDDNRCIEDYVINSQMLVAAAGEYIAGGIDREKDDVINELQKRFQDEYLKTERGERTSISKWIRETGKEIGKFENDPSSLGIAIKYSENLAESKVGDLREEDMELARNLCDLIARELELPDQILQAAQITERGE